MKELMRRVKRTRWNRSVMWAFVDESPDCDRDRGGYVGDQLPRMASAQIPSPIGDEVPSMGSRRNTGHQSDEVFSVRRVSRPAELYLRVLMLGDTQCCI